MEELARVGFRVLVPRGDRDYGVEALAQECVDASPLAELVRLPAAGHFLLLERPAAFREELMRFLR